MRVRGATIVPSYGDILREHRDRIRMLEANPPGVPPDGPWNPVTMLNWASAYGLNNTGPLPEEEADVAYLVTGNNWVKLRGRLVANHGEQPPYSDGGWQDGLHAFRLPVGARPAFDQWFPCDGGDDQFFGYGSGYGRVRVGADGFVTPFARQSGWMSGDASPGGFVSDSFNLASQVVGATLNPATWAAQFAGMPIYTSDGTGHGMGVPGGVPLTAMFLAAAPHADVQGRIVWGKATQITLGLRIPIHQWIPATQANGPGYWFRIPATAGSTMTLFYVTPDGSTNQLAIFNNSTSPPPSPGFTDGDVLIWRFYNYTFEMYKAGVGTPNTQPWTGAFVIGSAFPAGVNYTAVSRQGVSGITVAGPANVPLIRKFSVGLAGGAGVTLNNVFFKAA